MKALGKKSIMNFSPFGTHFPGTIPGIHQFASSGLVTSVPSSSHDTNNRYHSINSNVSMAHFNQSHAPILGKFRPEDTSNVINPNKYNGHNSATTITTTSGQYTIPYSQHSEVNDHKQRNMYHQTSSGITTGTTTQSSQEITQDLSALLQQADSKRVLQNPSWQSLAPGTSVADYLSHLPGTALPLSLHHFLKYSAENIKKETQNPLSTIDMCQAQSQNLNANTGQHPNGMILPASQTIASILGHQNSAMQQQQQQQHSSPQGPATSSSTINGANNAAGTGETGKKKKKKKKKPPKERKPRPKPGEIQVRTALDGSLLFLCPECQMAYPERELLEQHLIGHNLERRFICDICNAALKRKDHLTRHKQSHNPERPFVCTICLKAFKRKEQLTLHIVIHSGEKRHICQECGKGFYRKDHLRKHTRSHIARRLKAELQAQQGAAEGTSNGGRANNSNNQANQNQPNTAQQQQVPPQAQLQLQPQSTNQQLQPPQYHPIPPTSQMMS
ncbi:gastrula zinc finger protein 5-1 isoform X2 [Wyeomyia smithii]|uniref:gastrula zinc finger protein 5-1 isoform X2 n=1 Tax=Wyeomyia smithii TaxID=174621 RepID=UPI002467C961|nr:gastrula zinc finger protein 5-1 isoform X2 [Wyeomyia smithii]